MTEDAPLAGRRILVTRPAHQAAAYADSLRALGAEPCLLPALAILPGGDTATLTALAAALATFDLIICISPNAAGIGLNTLAALAPAGQPHPPLSGLRFAAIGKGTAQALAARGLSVALRPDAGADSEHLLALPAFQHVAGQRILIVRGEGGRETLADTLRQRGADVRYAEAYRRAMPTQPDSASTRAALHAGQIDAITVFSSETLDNLLQLLAETAPSARALPLFVPHPRIAAHATQQGFTQVITSTTDDSGMTHALMKYFAHV